MLVMCSPSSSASAKSCAELRTWAQPLAGTLSTLDDIARYDRPHRRALFSALTPAVQAALWREQITRFAEYPNVPPPQRILAREAIGLITPALYRHEATATQAFTAFWQRAKTAFADPMSKRAWTNVGALSTSLIERGHADQLFCDCSKSWATECPSGVCADAACTQTISCGPLALYVCDGICQ